MNIALFTDAYIPIKNGVSTSVNQLLEGLKEKGHNVYVIAPDIPNYEESNPNVYRLPSIGAAIGKGTEQRISFINYGAIIRFLKKKNIDIVHTHTEFVIGYCGKRIAKKLKIPCVHTTHTLWEEYRHYILNGKLISRKMARKIISTYLKNIYAIIAPSIKAKKYYADLTPNIPSIVVNNGISIEKFKSAHITEGEIFELRRQFGLKKTDKVIVFVGRIGKEKRVMDLFNSVIPVLKKNINYKMLFVGDGPELTHLAEESEKHNLTEQVVFTGFVNWEMVHSLYSLSDIFATASLSEVHPMTLIEASMCALPVIVREDDSYRDLVYNDENGFLCSYDKELTDKLLYLLEDEEKLKSFSKRSIEISQKFTAKNHVNKVEEFYKKAIVSFPNSFEEY